MDFSCCSCKIARCLLLKRTSVLFVGETDNCVTETSYLILGNEKNLKKHMVKNSISKHSTGKLDFG